MPSTPPNPAQRFFVPNVVMRPANLLEDPVKQKMLAALDPQGRPQGAAQQATLPEQR